VGLRGPNATPLHTRQVPTRGNPWDKPGLNRAERVIAFCEDLTITSGKDSGKLLKLRPWQRDFIKKLYREKDGIRVVRTAVLSLGRKNGKTQLAAALALCHLSGPEAESRAEVYACANDTFQAGKIFNEMNALVLHHVWLTSRMNVGQFRKTIGDIYNGGLYCTLSSEAKTKMGLSPSFCVYDELGQARDRELYDAMDTAMGARAEPLLLVISTQAADSFAPMSQLIDYGLKVNSGEIDDPSFLLVMYTADDGDDPWAESTWRKANPALGDFRSLEDVKRMAGQAQRVPSQENMFRNLILNQRVAAEARFMEPSLWKGCGQPPIIPPGAAVWAGLDLGSTRDLSALSIAYFDPVSGEVSIKVYVWVPGNLKEKGDMEGVPYPTWARQDIVIAAGDATDPRAVAYKIAEINSENPIQGLAFDRWRMAEIKRELDAIGCRVPLIEHGQGFRDMSPAVDLLERLVSQKKMRHGNNPVLTWCANNAVVIRDPAGNRKFDKSSTRYRAKIDALVSTAMALSAGMIKEKPGVVDISGMIG
jgi:phage terminase large subunit-like protein